MQTLLPIHSADDIPAKYRGTPIGLLLEYHNSDRPFDTFNQAELLVGMCMDNRKQLRIPDKFAYIIRAAGANLNFSVFSVAFAVAIGKIQHIALIGHNNCRMANVSSLKREFINGLQESAGWKRDKAKELFERFAPKFDIGADEGDFVAKQTERLRQQYPTIQIVPMMYRMEDNKLYLIDEQNIRAAQ